MADTPNGETANPQAPSNGTVTDNTSNGNVVDNAEVERLRKEAEQARLRTNQLENELARKKQQEEEAQRKQLEEQNEWKTIAEQNQAKLDAVLAEKQEAESRAALSTAESEVYAAFPADVVELAKEAGLSLTDASDESKARLQSTLEKLSGKISSNTKPKPNNPAPVNNTASTEELYDRMGRGDRNARAEVISNLPGVKAMRQQAGLE